VPATDPRSDPRSGTAPAERDAALGMTIDESARRVGSIVWAERRLFELLGGWVPSTPEPPVKLALARRSRHHAAHAATLDVVLPDTRDHDPRALVAAADPEDPGRFAELAALTGTDARLACLVDDLLPQRLEACEAFLASASAVRDGPAVRALILVLAEERAELTDLRALHLALA
jgi:hypothetical protein